MRNPKAAWHAERRVSPHLHLEARHTCFQAGLGLKSLIPVCPIPYQYGYQLWWGAMLRGGQAAQLHLIVLVLKQLHPGSQQVIGMAAKRWMSTVTSAAGKGAEPNAKQPPPTQNPKIRRTAGLPSTSQDTEKTLRAAPAQTQTPGAARAWDRRDPRVAGGGSASVSCPCPCSCPSPIPVPVQFLSPSCPFHPVLLLSLSCPRPCPCPCPILVPTPVLSLPRSFFAPLPASAPPCSCPVPAPALARPHSSPRPRPRASPRPVAPSGPVSAGRCPRPGPCRYRFCSRRSRSCGRGSAASSCSAMARPGNGGTGWGGGTEGGEGRDGSRSFQRPSIGFFCFSACWRPGASLVPIHFADRRFYQPKQGKRAAPGAVRARPTAAPAFQPRHPARLCGAVGAQRGSASPPCRTPRCAAGAHLRARPRGPGVAKTTFCPTALRETAGLLRPDVKTVRMTKMHGKKYEAWKSCGASRTSECAHVARRQQRNPTGAPIGQACARGTAAALALLSSAYAPTRTQERTRTLP